jgi:hypothetical protein
MTYRHLTSVSLVLLAGAAVCAAQSITTARSGTLHYFDGDVSVDGNQVTQQRGTFPQLKEKSVLKTGQGRAEVLLTPGVFLRLGENSSIRMLDERLISTRVEILDGTAMVESDDPQMSVKDSPVTLIYRDFDIQPVKHGLFEISSGQGQDPAELKVFKGEAVVETAGNRVDVREGHLMPFTAAMAEEKFSDKSGDDLYVWTRDRSESLAAANVVSAQSMSSSAGSGYYGVGSGYGSGYGYGNSGLYGMSPWGGGWFYNPYLSMFTFVPSAGVFWNPWGYGFFSPGLVGSYFPASTLTAFNRPGATGAIARGLTPSVGTASALGSPIRSASTGSSSARGGSLASAGFSGGGSRGGGTSHGGGGHR